MSLDLRNFVKININVNADLVSAATRGIVTLITKDTAYSSDPLRGKTLHSVSDYEKAIEDESIASTSLDAYVKAFFSNGGKALEIAGGYSGGSIEKFLRSVLQSLDYKHVLIVSDADEQDLRRAASSGGKVKVVPDPLTGDNTVPAFEGLNEKFFISSTTDRSGKLFDSLSEAETFAPNTYYKLIQKTGQYEALATKPEDWASNFSSYYKVAETSLNPYVIKVGAKGVEMLAAAYLSKVKISDSGTIQDYAFTIEDMGQFPASSIISDNDTGTQLINSHFNFDTKLVNAVRNYPGDTVTGLDMMNYYVKILLTQDLTEAVMNLLASKIRFNQAGINRLSNAISQAMNAYISNGYLNTDYIWTGDDLVYNFNSVDYLICARNTPLVKGYKCVILPLTSLTPAQKEAHVLPPVYMLFADQTGIRAVVINGDIY